MTRDSLVAAARELVALKVPFVHQGRNVAIGLDCIGVLWESLNRAGYVPRNPTTFATHNYSATAPSTAALTECVANEADLITTDALPGDFYLMCLGRRAFPQHVALVTDYGIIHTHCHTPFVCEHRLDPEHQAMIFSTYRFKDFADG